MKANKTVASFIDHLQLLKPVRKHRDLRQHFRYMNPLMRILHHLTVVQLHWLLDNAFVSSTLVLYFVRILK